MRHLVTSAAVIAAGVYGVNSDRQELSEPTYLVAWSNNTPTAEPEVAPPEPEPQKPVAEPEIEAPRATSWGTTSAPVASYGSTGNATVFTTTSYGSTGSAYATGYGSTGSAPVAIAAPGYRLASRSVAAWRPAARRVTRSYATESAVVCQNGVCRRVNRRVFRRAR